MQRDQSLEKRDRVFHCLEQLDNSKKRKENGIYYLDLGQAIGRYCVPSLSSTSLFFVEWMPPKS